MCPNCKSEDIKIGVMRASFGQVQMFPENRGGKSSPISAACCNECGYILSLNVDNPKNVERHEIYYYRAQFYKKGTGLINVGSDKIV